MWIFGKKKKEKQNDFDLLSGQGMIDFIKTNLDNPTDENVLKALKKMGDRDLEHLTPEGELPFGWVTANKDFIEPMDKKLSSLIQNVDCSSIDSEIEGLSKVLGFCESYKHECESKGECFLYYYNWMHGENENSGIEYRQQRLNYLRDNYEHLKDIEQKKKNLDHCLYNFLLSNNGILQKNIYKNFDKELKEEIQGKLYQWHNSGKIERIKTGNSYAIHVKEGQS